MPEISTRITFGLAHTPHSFSSRGMVTCCELLMIVEGDGAKKLFKAIKAGKITAHRFPVLGSIGEIHHAMENKTISLHLSLIHI